MKLLLISLAFIGFMAATQEANAYACRAGVYYSGCVSGYGATVRRHGYRGGAGRCVWRAGRRVCY